MSLHVYHHDGSLVVRAPSGARDDCLAQLTCVLEGLFASADRVVLDLRGVMLAPAANVVEFADEVSRLRDLHRCEVAIVAERFTARLVLRAAAPPDVAVVASLAEAFVDPRAVC